MFGLKSFFVLALPSVRLFASAWPAPPKVYKHVLAMSVDGLHSSDVGKYVALRPESTIASLLATGYEYTDAYTSAPSDSFPGTLAQFTGASPRTTGVWYDDTWDWTYYAPGSNCTGPPGAEVLYDETIDYNSTLLFSGGINPANLPLTIIDGVCTAIWPHSRPRVNTVFEVVHQAGLETAYVDKHPAYDLVRGPSGQGLSEGYFPEMASVANTVDAVIAYDQLHVDALLDWIDGASPANAEGSISAIPALFGGNFQAVSVAEKTAGYNKNLTFTAPLLEALDFVDASFGKIVAKLNSTGHLDDTLIIVASKHGQAPIDPSLYGKVDPDAIQNDTGVAVAWETADDIALIFLESHADAAAAAASLAVHASEDKMDDIIWGDRLTALGFGDPLTDPAVPDVIVRPDLGIIFTTSTKKIAEHGGLSDDDRKVACFVSNPSLKPRVYNETVSTMQVAPTILKALGLDTQALQGVVAEGTNVFPGFKL